MKGFRFLTKSLIFVLILAGLALAQTEKTQTPTMLKVALINTEAFNVKVTGIREIVEINDKLETEFKPLVNEFDLLAERIQKLQKEIEVYQIHIKKFAQGCYPSLDKFYDEYGKLTSEYKQKQEESKKIYEKRKSEVFADVYKKVGDAIKQFAKEKGYAHIVDISKDSCFCVCNYGNDDVTKEFIKYYNENFAEKKNKG